MKIKAFLLVCALTPTQLSADAMSEYQRCVEQQDTSNYCRGMRDGIQIANVLSMPVLRPDTVLANPMIFRRVNPRGGLFYETLNDGLGGVSGAGVITPQGLNGMVPLGPQTQGFGSGAFGNIVLPDNLPGRPLEHLQ